MKAVIMIPARYGSARLPGKPLAMIRGKSLLQRTWSLAKAVNRIEQVYIATDDPRIEEHARSFGANVLMTPENCINGTVRSYVAANALHPIPDIILNLQGDAVLTPPWVIQALVDVMLDNPAIELATTATQLSLDQYQQMQHSKLNGKVGGTTVVFDKKGHALYFSKSLIPFLRDTSITPLPIYRHIGLYIYRYQTLKKYVELPPSQLELAEGLEQLRALENGIPINVVTVDYKGRTHWAVDSQDDITMVEKIIGNEGELV